MAEVPPGPSRSLLASPPSLLPPFPGAAEEEEEEEEEGEGRRRRRRPEEGEGGQGEAGDEGLPLRRPPCPPHRLHHQLNGLIAGPHLRGALKGKALTGSKAAAGHEEPPHSNHRRRLSLPKARTAPQHHHRRPSAGDRNGLALGAEGDDSEEKDDEEGEEEEQQESLLLLSRSLAQKCSTGPPTATDSSWPSGQGEEGEEEDPTIRYVRYESELQMPDIMRLITKDLSEPYSIYTYRYFIHNWPQLCFLAMVGDECVGAIVCKLDMHKKMFRRGYIAMLAVDSKYRRKGIGTNLVKKAIYAMVEGDCDEVVLETEITNKSALKLYENLGFVRDKRLFRYYLNGVDALRLKLWLR
ncbi:N-alpha-acetyltransferase 30 [Anolis carolinensis]|uniref:N-alpha-acetyltransferase 30 n=1 Tax=Anolis carolinensis TaxID=28377 RepID=UPI002F2B6834